MVSGAIERCYIASTHWFTCPLTLAAREQLFAGQTSIRDESRWHALQWQATITAATCRRPSMTALQRKPRATAMSSNMRFASRRHATVFCASLAQICLCTPAIGQTYPSKAIRLVLGFPAGTNVDVLARPIAQHMSEALGQPVIVENRPGATGLIANELVAKAAADGYTLLVAPGSSLTSSPHLKLKMPYDSLQDFVPIIQMNSFPQVLIANPVVPARTVRELIALARARPGVLTFGSSGSGSAFHLAGELFRTMAKIDMLHVPYKGGNIALNDLIGGRLDVMFYSLAIANPHIAAGKLRAIAVTGLEREPLQPEVPTVDESGLKGYEMIGWHGFFGPAGTSREVIVRLNAAVAEILRTRQIGELWASQGMKVVTNTPEQFAQRVRADYEKYRRIVKAVGIKPE
jgi:tripartite-type tricarboxylate transporter receptor subunit TctC